MKKQLLKLGAICIALTIAGNVMGQAAIKTGTFKATETAITIDGVADAIWANVEAYPIELNWPDQSISMLEGSATFKALWDATNTYVLVTVPDDHQFDHVEAGVASWLADKPEVYFDVNAVKVEDPAVGPSTAGSGHFQFASDFTSMETPPTNCTVAFTIDGDDAGYIFEYAVPHATLIDIDGATFAPGDGLVIGFDVTILDLDAEGKGANIAIGRANWSNDMLSAGESWVDMTMSGDVTYSSEVVTPGGSSIKQSVSKVDVTVVKGQLTFSTKVSNVTVLNSIGQVVSKSQNVSNLPKGVYIATAKSSKGDVASKFVIQ